MKTPIIDWGVAILAFAGSEQAGDAYLVKTFENHALVAAIDGLGHGDPAAQASRLAVDVLDSHASEDLVALTRRCHAALKGTRGVVFSLALFRPDDDAMTWLGIGNVEGVLSRRNSAPGKRMSETLFVSSGVIGYNLQSIRPSVLPVAPGDTLVLATDGIRSGFAGEVHPEDPPRGIADRIIAKYGKQTDDALVLVVRYLGGARHNVFP